MRELHIVNAEDFGSVYRIPNAAVYPPSRRTMFSPSFAYHPFALGQVLPSKALGEPPHEQAAASDCS